MHKKDIFGIAFADYLSGNKDEVINVAIDIFGDEDLPVSYFFRHYDEMPDYEQMALDECRGKILDVGAGAGSHSLYLQQKGLNVTAIDISEGAVNCMIKRGLKDARVQDFFKLTNEKFDTVLLLMNGAGMAGNIDNLKDMLLHLASLLAPGASAYLESTDLLYMYKEEDGSAFIDLSGDYYGEVEYSLSYRSHKGEPFPWLFVDYGNLSEKAEMAGLDCEMFYQGETDNYVARLSLKTQKAK